MKWGRKSQIEETYKLNKYNTCQNTRLLSKEHLSTSIYTHTHTSRATETNIEKAKLNNQTSQLYFHTKHKRRQQQTQREKNIAAKMYLTFVCVSILVIFFFLFVISLPFSAYLLRNSICHFCFFFLFCCFVFFYSATNGFSRTDIHRYCHLFHYDWERAFFLLLSKYISLSFLRSSVLLTVMYVYISLENVNFMLLFKLNILPYVCFPFYCHALSHLSLIETVMFTL